MASAFLEPKFNFRRSYYKGCNSKRKLIQPPPSGQTEIIITINFKKCCQGDLIIRSPSEITKAARVRFIVFRTPKIAIFFTFCVYFGKKLTTCVIIGVHMFSLEFSSQLEN